MFEDNESYGFCGYGIKGYRSFTSDEIARVGPFGKVHLITGQNNTGKSAIADIAYRILPEFVNMLYRHKEANLFKSNDVPQANLGTMNEYLTIALCFSRNSLLSRFDENYPQKQSVRADLEALLSSPQLSLDENNFCWIAFDIPFMSTASIQSRPVLNEQLANMLSEEFNTDFQELAFNIVSRASSSSQENLGRIMQAIIPWDYIPQVKKVEAIRYVTNEPIPDPNKISGGRGLIKKLRQLQMPTVEEQFESQRKWKRFNDFIRDILNDPIAEISTDAEGNCIHVKSETLGFLELSDLGTGIEELIIIAAVVACNDDTLIYIEEPEIHLHPTLQTKLIKYFLDDENGNRFLITTHSPSIINMSGVTVTRVIKKKDISIALQARNLIDVRDILDDIGAKPSDLLQSNYIIWVEGPSDRIYVNYWLSQVAPVLKEGTHYSVMLYGGKLLNACDAGVSNEEEDLIKLFRINTHFCVLMDSDRAKKGARLNSTKMRIREECASSKNMSWITEGKTIENYIPSYILRKAINEFYPNQHYEQQLDDQYIGPLDGKFKGKNYGPDKIKIARRVAEKGHDLSPELSKRVEELAKRIKEANNL